MNTNVELDELKKQVELQSQHNLQLTKQSDEILELITTSKQRQQNQKQEISSLVRDVFIQSEIATVKERELIQDKLTSFSHRQDVMNKQLIKLNDSLADIKALNAVYEAKRERLEQYHQNQKEELQQQLNELNELINARRTSLEELKKEIDINISKLSKTSVEMRKNEFFSKFKRVFIHNFIIYSIIAFLALILGGFFGWGIFTLFSNFFSSIFHLFS